MKTTAIICEFNPLHSGHKKLIDYAKTFSDRVVCIMSGNFTQRGLPACCDKYARAKHAVLAGADLVVELPTIFAAASAENFAYGGVAAASKLPADFLLFGSECGDIKQLTDCANALLDKDVNRKIADEIKKGISYPKAVSNIVKTPLLNKPNNVLAIEYIKNIITAKSRITPITLIREDNYNSLQTEQYASSAALRADKKLRKKFTYDYVSQDINDEIEDKFGTIACGIISLKTPDEMHDIEGVSEGIENKIFASNKSNGYNTMLEEIKSKRYPRLRLQRTILNIILNISKERVTAAKNTAVCICPLAVKSTSAAMLAFTNKCPDEITQRADRLYYTMSTVAPPSKLIKME